MNIDLKCDLAKEILITSSYLKNINIPENIFREIVKLAADSTKDVYIDMDKSLEEQDISDECKNWLTFFYYDNLDESLKEELLQDWQNNIMHTE